MKKPTIVFDCKNRQKIIYDPNVNILHYEFASSSNTGSSDHAIALMEKINNF